MAEADKKDADIFAGVLLKTGELQTLASSFPARQPANN